MRNTIYIDMDGVVADFNGYVSKMLGRPVQWTDRSITKDEWGELIALGNLYYNLPMLVGNLLVLYFAHS